MENISRSKQTKIPRNYNRQSPAFNSHTNYTAKKIAKKVNFLYRLNKYISSYTLVVIYKSVIAPHFEYYNTVMLNFSEISMSVMQKAQNRAMRAILRCNKYTPIQQMRLVL